MKDLKKIVYMVFWFYIVFPSSAGFGWMLLAGVLHSVLGFPLFGFWTSVGMMALISWLIGSFQLRWFLGNIANEDLIS